ncbi:MAG: pectate lyase [Phycisphaerae bacterium]|nr:pectate lyase [Phycisphaerae bacterium]
MLHAQQLAFPTAEGYGKYTVGGRGGKVIEVTNLNASGPGSFADAVKAKGPRTVVFRVSGTIDADVTISNGKITIAGQTAPGDGITLKGRLSIRASNVIIRYIRVRAEARNDAFGGRYNDNIIIDHVSASWSSDEVMSIYHGNYVTIQWCMITEACSGSHKYGGIWGNNHGTYHHNLIAHNTDRNPRIASGAGYNDIRNNVIYNWKNESTYGGEVHQVGNSKFVGCSTNLVANYYKPGPGTPSKNKTRICSPWSRNGAADYGDWYVADNYLAESPEVTADNWKGVFPQYTKHIPVDLDAIPGLKLDSPSEYMPINQQTAEQAYISVLEHAGCSLPKRDSVDIRIIEEVRNGTATYGSNGFINSPSVVGGWPELKSTLAPTDSDHDGMPDKWETKKGLNPNNASDRNKVAGDGYTMLEKYLNSIK